MKLIMIVMILFVPAFAGDCDCERFSNIRNKMQYQCTAEELALINSCVNDCTADGKEKKRKHDGKGWLITGIVITSILVVGALNEASK